MNQVGTGTYAGTVPTTNRTTNVLIVKARDSKNNANERTLSNFCI
jgi:hypothetical protein